MLRLIACLLTFTFTANLHAQQVRMNAPKFALLINDIVIKELNLTTEQKDKIKEVLGDSLQEVDGQKRLVIRHPADLDAMDADCIKVLNDKQAKRLREAWLQNNGAMAITEEQLAKDLKITRDQSSKAEEALQKMNSDLAELFQSGADRQEQLPKLKEIRANTRKAVEALLTKDQLAKLTELQGTKIKGLGNP